ncbi:MAG: hypothetical protein ACJAQW_002288, partial [Paracoccaceae bacterium]
MAENSVALRKARIAIACRAVGVSVSAVPASLIMRISDWCRVCEKVSG